MDKLICRVCSHGEAVSLGPIPDCGVFAGNAVAPAIKGGDLWRCKDCESMFRYPTLPLNEYLAFYEKAPGGVWEDGRGKRNDITTISAYLENHSGGSILDVGCYAGQFLEGIPEKFEKYGVEPSRSAAESATSKGIDILGRTLADLDDKLVFDVVVAIDVIEHVLDVGSFMAEALSHVRNNGLFIISTGDPCTVYWKKIFKARYWYCSYPEHLAFPSYKYFREFSKSRDLPLPEQIPIKYCELNARSFLTGFIHQLVYAISPPIYSKLTNMRHGMKGNPAPMADDMPLGAPGVFRDHQIVIFRNRK